MADLLGALSRLTVALDRSGIEYALAGGMALAVRARPRATVDLDLVIAAVPDRLADLRAACAAAGLVQTRRPVARFKRIGLLRMLAVDDRAADAIAVDFLLIPAALEQPLLRRASAVTVGGRAVRVVTAEDLVLLKLLRDSDQDRVDIASLAEVNRLDREYLRAIASRLRLLTRLHRLLGR